MTLKSLLSPRILGLLAFLGASIVMYIAFADYLSFEALGQNKDALLTFRQANPVLMAVGFFVVYTTIVAFSLPGAAVASITGGFLFGLGLGTVLNVSAATLGALIIFGVVRFGFGRALAARLAQGDGAAARIQKGLRENEISVLLLIRLIPIVPFFVANIAPALVGVKGRNFLWTTFVGILPGGLVFTWIGVGVSEILEQGGVPDLSIIWSPHIMGPILGLCVLSVLPIFLKSMGWGKV